MPPGVVITGDYGAISSTTTSPSAHGSMTVNVADGSVFSIGQYVSIGGGTYLVAGVAGNILSLSSPLLMDVSSGSAVIGYASTSLNTGPYAVAHQTLLDLEAMSPRQAVMVEMQDREAVHVRSQVIDRSISFNIYLLSPTMSQRRADYEAFVDTLDSLSGLVTLRWTAEDGRTREFLVSTLSVSPDAWYQRCSAVLVAPDPYARLSA